jgi:hypothetical protein
MHTKTQILINTPLISNLHSNYNIMKRRDEIDWSNLKSPLQRPKRKEQQEYSQIVSRERLDDFACGSVMSNIRFTVGDG